MSTICSLNIYILNFSLRFLNGHLPSAQSRIRPVPAAVAYFVSHFLIPKWCILLCATTLLHYLFQNKRKVVFFFTPLFTSFSPIIFPCLHLSFNLKPQKKPGGINTVCSSTLQSNCTGSYTMSKQKVQITSFIILTPYSLPFSVLIVLEGTDYIFPFSFLSPI